MAVYTKVQEEFFALLREGKPCHAAPATYLSVRAASGSAALLSHLPPHFLVWSRCCPVSVINASVSCQRLQVPGADADCFRCMISDVSACVMLLSGSLSSMPQQASGPVPPCPAVSGWLLSLLSAYWAQPTLVHSVLYKLLWSMLKCILSPVYLCPTGRHHRRRPLPLSQDRQLSLAADPWRRRAQQPSWRT